MAKLTPDEAARKQADRLKASLEDIRKGIAKVTVAPTQQAAAQKDKMLLKLTEKINDGTWEKNLRKVSLSEWQDKAANVGVNRIPAGIDAAQSKQVEFYTKLLPAVDAAKAKVKAMPSVTLQDNINRMVTYIQEMAKFHK